MQQVDQQVVVGQGHVVDDNGDGSNVAAGTVVLPGVPLAIPLPQVHMPVQQQAYIPSYSFQDASRPIQYSTPTYIPATYYQHDPNQQHAASQPQYHPVQPQTYAYHPATTHHVQQVEQDPNALQNQGEYVQEHGSPSQQSSQPTSRRGRGISETGPVFKATVQKSTLWSLDRTRNYSLRIYPKIDRGFFLADNDWTCYRRNYFQVSATFTAIDPHGQRVELPCYVEVEDRLRTVTGFLINCVAKTHNGNKEIELVQHTAKRDKGPQNQPQPRLCEPMDPTVRHEDSFHSVTFERLQFKSATANNGKRRAAQQYHVLLVELFVRCDDGHQFKVASSESAPLVVRGRAPGHYAAMSTKQAAQQAGTLTADMGYGDYPYGVAEGSQQAHYQHSPSQHGEAATHYYQPIHQQSQQNVSHYYQAQTYDTNLWNQQGHTGQYDQTGATADHSLHYSQQQLAGGYQPTSQMVDANGHPVESQQAHYDQHQAHYSQAVYQQQDDGNLAVPSSVEGGQHLQGVLQHEDQADPNQQVYDQANAGAVDAAAAAPTAPEPAAEAPKSAKKRGRPKKGETEDDGGADLPPKKKRGRPKKGQDEEVVDDD
ncbi:meiosis-specific transcription factor ndt80 [Phlyctochytrium planicorne]|nr:meiosis-specific transcription factor ndt80 [Phlyctochytrium planicorne]